MRDLHPDLLLLDVFLPDGSGLDVLRQLSGDEGGDRPDAIMITADRDITSVRTAMKLGAVGYLVKPFGAPTSPSGSPPTGAPGPYGRPGYGPRDRPG